MLSVSRLVGGVVYMEPCTEQPPNKNLRLYSKSLAFFRAPSNSLTAVPATK